MAVAVGDLAPDFSLPGVHEGERSEYRLSSQRGAPVVLVLYPGDNSVVCTRQLASYTEDIEGFADVGATVWAISPQDLDSHERFAGKHSLAMPLLADTDKEVFGSYGCLGPLGFPRRSVFVVDGDGRLAYAHRSYAGVTFKSSDDLIDAVRAAGD